MAEEARSPRQDATRGVRWPRGPRSLLLRRCDHGGFGFTLRHFIVYPPESYTVLAGDRRLGLRAGALDEPMDTIFVKQVRAGSPADRAGLRIGDRVVSVNGETVSGLSYAAVVHRINNSSATLHLLVVPQQDDILQLYFNDTAHRPESNLDVECGNGMVRGGAAVGTRNAPWEMAGARRTSETFSVTPADSNESIQGSGYGYPSNMAGCRLSLDAGLMSRRDSVSQEGSVGEHSHSSDDSVIISRIRRSCEQKEEFLRRPAAPLWPHNGTTAGPPQSGIKEFYARPQKLQPPPHWPPALPQSPHHSPSRHDRDETPPRDGHSRGFVCGGPVTNAPGDRRQRPAFVTTLGRIQETSPPINHPQLQVVSQRARQFESGTMPDRTSLYRSELARLSNKHMVPEVVVRAREYETKHERHRESRSLDSAAAIVGRILTKETKKEETKREQKPEKKDASTFVSNLPPMSGLSGNRLIPIGGRRLHCEPPLEPQPLSYDEGVRPRSNSAESWSEDLWPQRHKAMRQDSYLAACHKPSLPTADAPKLGKRVETAMCEGQHGPGTPQSPIPEIRIEPVRPEAVVEPMVTCRPARPTTLDLSHSLPRPSSLDLPHPRDSDGTRDQDGSGTEDDSNSTPLGSPSVTWRDKLLNDTGSEEDRATRRVSYLKATWPDRMDSDPDLSDTEPLPLPPVRPARRWRPPLFPNDIQRIRRFFEDTPDKRKGVGGQRHSLCDDISLPDKENQQVCHEGSLNCKLTLVDGKRATDRSWKQVWAVLRGPVLCLYKERRDSLPLPETPVGAEGDQVDVRCALVGPAENYTKRKHVLRVNTLAGSELLLQAADAGQMARWIEALEEQANNNNSQNLSGTSLSPASAQKGLRKLTSLRNRSPTGQSPVNKTRKPSQQVVEGVPSPKSKTWKGRVAKQLRRIQHSGSPVSPTAIAPHPEGATIDVPLEECPPSANNEFVPLLVELCTGIVEARGLDIIGIYRVPGNTAAVSSLTEAVNRGLEPGILAQDQRWTDVNVISSLLKSFFRRLPDSLLTTELYPSFIRADKIADPHLRMATIRRLVHDLPDHHYETLKYLLLHLKKVVEHAATNKMEARNLAIVFGPTLVRAADDNMVTMVTDMSHQCRIVETLILHVDWCFGDETVERLALEGVEGGGVEPDPSVANHNLLLGNIHKVEGMGRELSARDIVSSIICAANRKMMKSKTRKSHAEDTTDHSAESKQRLETKSKQQHRKERLASTEDASSVETGQQSIRLETKSKQQHRKERLASTEDASSVETGQQSALAAVSQPAAPQPTSLHDNMAATEEQAVRPQLDDGTIRTYAGLSATTQERIRRFELETKAMLHRDSAARLRRLEPEQEREQSKRELEMDDHTNPPAIVKKIAETGRSVKPLAIVPPSTGRGRHKEEGGAGSLRRGSSAENVNAPVEKQANGNLKRFKSGKEQGEASLGRCGSLDSLHDLTPSDRPPSHASEEGGDLLVSLTSTFDAKLRSLLSSGASTTVAAERSPSPAPSHPLFSDPSLHKASDKEGKEEESKECCEEKDKSNTSNLLTQGENMKDMEGEPRTVRLSRSESMNRDERMVFRSESLKSDSGRRCSESLNKEKLKRSDSLTKNEKTESNLNKRRQLEAGRWLKRKTGSAVDRSIKRRHTVGGTKDFDKSNWLDNRQREAEEEGKKERRTSSPDLSSSRLAAMVILRPHSFAEPERLCGIPLESHV